MERTKSEWLRKQHARIEHKRAVRTATILHNLSKAIRADLAVLLDPAPVVATLRATLAQAPVVLRMTCPQDGETHTCTLDAFCEDNEGCEFLDAVCGLAVGERVDLGGGAAPSVVVERVS